MKRISLLLVTFIVPVLLIAQSWEGLNPGAGGQVQDVYPDPNTEGKIFLVSDMEGVYQSNDNGQRWQISSNGLVHARAYRVAVEPGNSDRVYCATQYGLHYSDDGGRSWQVYDATLGESVDAIAIAPNNPRKVFAGPGWTDDTPIKYFGKSKRGDGMVYYSHDRGASWQTSTFATDLADKTVWQISVDPTNEDIVYIGTEAGVYRSDNGGVRWSKIDTPPGMASNRGIAVSPDGKILYATYRLSSNASQSAVWATPTGSIGWKDITSGLTSDGAEIDYWLPEIDPRSTATRHNLLVGPRRGGQPGLREATVNWNDDTLVDHQWKQIWEGYEGYEVGWEYTAPKPRVSHYTAADQARAIWTTGDQNIYQGVPGATNAWGYTWNNKYCIPNEDIQVPFYGFTVPTFSSRGTSSTFTYDVTGHDNYIIQAQADNGWHESWDNGQSWSQATRVINNNPGYSDARSVAMAEITQEGQSVPTVLTHASYGYGGNADDGYLYAKPLLNHSPDDQWQLAAGGPNTIAGLPNVPIGEIAVDPQQRSRVFLSQYDNNDGVEERGFYYIADLNALLEDPGSNPVTKISDEGVRTVTFHPADPNVIYYTVFSGDQGLYRAELVNGAWQATRILDGRGYTQKVSSWQYGGTHYLLYSGLTGQGSNYSLQLSTDGGSQWETIFTPKDAQAINQPVWFDKVSDQYIFKTNGVVGYENQIIVGYYHHEFQRTYGVYRGLIQDDGSIDWELWDEDLDFGGFTGGEVVTNQDGTYLYTGTAGNGFWRRRLDSESSQTTTLTEYTVRARGKSGTERVQVRADDNVVADFSLSTTYADYSFTAASDAGIKVVFVNDVGTRADVQIDHLQRGQTTWQAEAQASNTGNWSATEGCGGGGPSEWLYCAGYIEFETTNNRAHARAKMVGKTTTDRSAGPLEVYPNPTNDQVHIALPKGQCHKCQLEVTDVQGRVMYQLVAPEGQIRLSTEQFPRGVYIIKASGANQQWTRRLIVE